MSLLPLALAALIAGAACTSAESSLSAPSASKCHVTLANSMGTAPASGGPGSLAVTTARDCTWAASATAPWIVITSSSNGQGDASVPYRVAANSEPIARRAAIEVNDASAAIVQEAAECRFTVAPQTPNVEPAGGTVPIEVQTHASCGWTAASEAGWMHLTASSGTGSGSTTLVVAGNDGPARSGTARIAGATVTVLQAGESPGAPAPAPPSPQPACAYSIQPAGQTMSADGGAGAVAVTTAPSCSWTATANVSWITLSGTGPWTGAASVGFKVAPNGGGSRTGTMSVAGQTFTLTQAGVSCSYSIAPASEAMSAAGGTSIVTVTAGASCAWVSASHAPWITIESGASGSGTGPVRLGVAQNGGAARTGTATIAGQTFTIAQGPAPCTFAIAPPSLDFQSGGGSGTVTVSSGAGCAWMATSNAPWIAVTSGASGTGSGPVSIAVDMNPGAARSGTVTIGGQTLTVTQQAAPCTYAIDPASQTMSAAGGTGSVAVTAAAGCGWNAVSSDPSWLTIASGASGAGSGPVSFTVAPNTGLERSATLTIAGHIFILTQAATP
jgi:hypothetical protein